MAHFDAIGEADIQYSTYVNATDDLKRSISGHEVGSISLELNMLLKGIAGKHEKIVVDALEWTITNGKIEATDADATALQQSLSSSDYSKFISLINRYYSLSRFDQFYLKNKEVYSQAEELYNAVLKQFDTKAFTSLFGQDISNINVYVSLMNKGNSYSVSGQNAIILGGICDEYVGNDWQHRMGIDKLNFKAQYAITLSISELLLSSHLDRYDEETYESSKWYYTTQSVLFQRNNIDISEVYKDQMVRLSALYYIANTKSSQLNIEDAIILQKREGFSWTNELYSIIKEQYDTTKYRTIVEFLPVVTSRYNDLLK